MKKIYSFKRWLYSCKRQLERSYFLYKVKRQCRSYAPPLKVNYLSSVSRNTILGMNVNFNGMKIKGQGLVTIGDNFHSGEDCLMITSFHQFDGGDSIPYDSKKSIDKPIYIGENVWFGDRVIVLGGASIGEGSIIQAGSVVVSDIEKYSIAGGHPAKVFKRRNIEHYEKLKNEGKFH